MSQLEYVQKHEDYGKSTFSALATNFCQSPQLSDITSELVFKNSPISILSIDKQFPISVYQDDEPVVIISLSSCEAFAHILQRQDILTSISQQQFPMVKFLHDKCSKTMTDLIECICCQQEFINENIDSLDEDFKKTWAVLLQDIADVKLDQKDIDQLFEDVYVQKVNRQYFPSEKLFMLLKNKQCLMLPFLQRFGAAPGHVTALFKGVPYMLGQGDYLVIRENFSDKLNNIHEASIKELADACSVQYVQSQIIKSDIFIFEDSNQKHDYVFKQLKFGERSIKICIFSGSEQKFDFVCNSIFEASNYYLIGNLGTLNINDQRKMIPGQYQVGKEDKIEGYIMNGMMDERTPGIVLVGVD